MNNAKIPHLAKSLIAIPSVSGNKAAVRKALAVINQILSSHGHQTQLLTQGTSPVLWSTTQDFAACDVLVLCHIDVVAAPKKLFVPHLLKGRLLGRGAFDMKGPVSAMLAAITQAKTSKSIHLIVTADEEIGGASAAQFFRQTRLTPKIAIVPDGLEHNTLIIKQKGPMHLVIAAKGVSSHASKPWLGENPIETLERIQQRIKGFDKEAKHENDWLPTFTTTSIQAQAAINQLPQLATMTLDIRATNQHQITMIKRIIKQEGGQITRQFGDGKIFTQENSPALQQWATIAKEVTQQWPLTTISAGASAARHRPKNTQTIVTQANGGGAHADNEWVEVNSLENLAVITKKCIETF